LVGDRAWSLVFSSQPEFFLDSPFRPAPWVLATGLAFSVLLFSVTRSQAMLYRSAHRHATELEQRVARRTAQLEAANRDLQKEAAERNRAERQIRESQRELREYVDNMSTLNAKVALDGTLLLVNRIAEIGSGLSREELMRTKFLEGAWWTFDPDVLARATAAFQRAVAGETVNYDETLFVFGRAVPINFSLVPVRDECGRVAYLLAEGRDISALKRAEQALKLRTTELEAAVQELEAFSYSVSHDLRAPVRHIGSFSEMILADSSATLDTNSRQNLMIVRESARRMGRLIDDLLSFSRMARSELSQTTVDTARLVEAIVETLRRDAPDRRVEWKIGPLPKARGDQAMLELVFTNLLSNALKYTHTREAAVIEIGVRPGADSETVFFVRDNGVGFDMKYIGKLFHVFQRLHRAEEFEGTGIGLANVRRIVHRHGGRVWAESAVDRGAIFFFSLPNQHHTHDETQKNSSG
jgi:PAS domain S-box-containing protein